MVRLTPGDQSGVRTAWAGAGAPSVGCRRGRGRGHREKPAPGASALGWKVNQPRISGAVETTGCCSQSRGRAAGDGTAALGSAPGALSLVSSSLAPYSLPGILLL